MPNIKSAKKRMRTSEEHRCRNRASKTRIKNVRRAFLEAAETSATESAPSSFKTYCSVLDKAAKKGTISRNTAIRRKRRAAARLRSAAETAPASDV